MKLGARLTDEEVAVNFAERADENTAGRFIAEAEQTFIDLAENRELGVSLRLRDMRVAELRKWRVRVL